MGNRVDRRRLQLRRERLRQLAELPADEVRQVIGGSYQYGFMSHGRAQSKGCP